MKTTLDKLHHEISLKIVNAERLTFSEGVSADVYGLGSVKYGDLSFKGFL